jgi:hypothetical protein
MVLPFYAHFGNPQIFHSLFLHVCRECRVKRMTSRLKSDRGSSVVLPRSWREVPRLTGSIELPSKPPKGS